MVHLIALTAVKTSKTALFLLLLRLVVMIETTHTRWYSNHCHHHQL